MAFLVYLTSCWFLFYVNSHCILFNLLFFSLPWFFRLPFFQSPRYHCTGKLAEHLRWCDSTLNDAQLSLLTSFFLLNFVVVPIRTIEIRQFFLTRHCQLTSDNRQQWTFALVTAVMLCESGLFVACLQQSSHNEEWTREMTLQHKRFVMHTFRK